MVLAFSFLVVFVVLFLGVASFAWSLPEQLVKNSSDKRTGNNLVISNQD
jgi:hypothetical protein